MGMPQPGDVLDDRFVITEVISRSGMALIFKAQDLHNDNADVAIKVPHMDFESDAGFFTRFKREEEIGLKLDHPYVLKFIPMAGEKGRPYLVTEYLRGCTLAHLMNAMRPFPEKDALKIASLVCEALQHMHDELHRGVVVIQHQHLVERGLTRPRLGLDDDAGRLVIVIALFGVAHSWLGAGSLG